MSSRTLSSVLRIRNSIFSTRRSQPLQKVSYLALRPTRLYTYTANRDDPFDDDNGGPPSKHELPNTKLRSLINNIPLDQKVRYILDGSEDTHPTPEPTLLEAISKPTTLPYTVGTDICHLPRIQHILQRQLADPLYVEPDMPRFWTRVLHPLEARYSGWKSGGALERSARFIAGRWAAKEAVIKAFAAAYPGLDKIFMHDIIIMNAKVQNAVLEAQKAAVRIAAKTGGKTPQQLHGLELAAAVSTGAPRAFVKVPVKEVGWVEVSMSISHDGEYATATAVVAVDPRIAGVKREKSVARGVIAKTYTDARYA